MDKPDNQNRTEKEALPDLAKLSPAELEALIARKRQEDAGKVKGGVNPLASKAAKPAPRPATRPQPRATPKPQTMEERFRPTGLEVKPKKPRKNRLNDQRWRNYIGYTLEAIVIIAVLLVVGNWLLQQFGISINLFEFLRPSHDNALIPSRLEGPLLIANAPGVLLVRVPATATPVATMPPETLPPTPAELPTALATATLAATPATVAPAATATPSGPAPVIAPTPTPVIVQPRPANQPGPLLADETSAIVARRIAIPRIGLDSPVQEVTVDLGTWQVADFAVGHHLGTANPGQVGNMVLAGHRDIRGSVFLRLNELQVGDELRIFTNKAVYRYSVTSITEVAPTEIEVMSPTPDATATLITCTPVGLATRRLIVKAQLQP